MARIARYKAGSVFIQFTRIDLDVARANLFYNRSMLMDKIQGYWLHCDIDSIVIELKMARIEFFRTSFGEFIVSHRSRSLRQCSFQSSSAKNTVQCSELGRIRDTDFSDSHVVSHMFHATKKIDMQYRT